MTADGSANRSSPEHRLAAMLDQLLPEGRLGLAVSGGPDSLALLLLAASVRPGRVEAATVDHGLRPASAAEAAMVAEACSGLGVPHRTLTVSVPKGSSLQAQAREARYAALEAWALERELTAIATAHHLDDQAETLLMRLAWGSGLSGLVGVRRSRTLKSGVRLVRPLLDWRKAELAAVVIEAGLQAVDDPANRDLRHQRGRARELLETVEWLDSERMARSAAALAEAEEALSWMCRRLQAEQITREGGTTWIEAGHLPAEIQRRLLVAELRLLGAEALRGPDVDHALEALRKGDTCTLAGVKMSGGGAWRLELAPPRRR